MTPVLIDPALDVAIRGGIALLLLAAAAHKLRGLAQFRDVVSAYELLPPAAVSAAASLVVVCEIAVALGLLLSPEVSRAVWSLAAASLFVGYAAVIAVNLYRGRREIDCGCGFGSAPERLGPWLLVRNGILTALALVASAPLAPRRLVGLDSFTVLAAVGGAAFLYATSERLRALPRPISGDILR